MRDEYTEAQYAGIQASRRKYKQKLKSSPEGREKLREESRIRNWKNRGISVAEARAAISAHAGVCDLCGATEPGGRGTWHIDHDHSSGAVRGLLCRSCNAGLGYFKDDPSVLSAAIAYLARCRSVEPA